MDDPVGSCWISLDQERVFVVLYPLSRQTYNVLYLFSNYIGTLCWNMKEHDWPGLPYSRL